MSPKGTEEVGSIPTAPTNINKQMIGNTVQSRAEIRSLFLIELSVACRYQSHKTDTQVAAKGPAVALLHRGVTALLLSWLLLKDHRRPADSFPFEVDDDLDTVGNFDKRNTFVHPIVFTVEGHCSFDRARACSPTGNRKRQPLLLGYSAYREVAVKRNRVGTGLFNFSS
jgi:hypothetical protein